MQVQMKGTILPNDWAEVMRYYGFEDNFCPGDLKAALDSGEDIELVINSDGGSLVAGTEIYSLLVGYTGHTTAHIQSRAASAATVAMMACDRIVAEPVSLICVHNPSVETAGDSHTLRHTAEELDKVKDSIIAAYRGRSKVTDEEMAALMDKDLFISAEEAMEYGLVDAVLERKNVPTTLVNKGFYCQLPTVEMLEDYQREKTAKVQAAKAKMNNYRF